MYARSYHHRSFVRGPEILMNTSPSRCRALAEAIRKEGYQAGMGGLQSDAPIAGRHRVSQSRFGREALLHRLCPWGGPRFPGRDAVHPKSAAADGRAHAGRRHFQCQRHRHCAAECRPAIPPAGRPRGQWLPDNLYYSRGGLTVTTLELVTSASCVSSAISAPNLLTPAEARAMIGLPRGQTGERRGVKLSRSRRTSTPLAQLVKADSAEDLSESSWTRALRGRRPRHRATGPSILSCPVTRSRPKERGAWDVIGVMPPAFDRGARDARRARSPVPALGEARRLRAKSRLSGRSRSARFWPPHFHRALTPAPRVAVPPIDERAVRTAPAGPQTYRRDFDRAVTRSSR